MGLGFRGLEMGLVSRGLEIGAGFHGCKLYRWEWVTGVWRWALGSKDLGMCNSALSVGFSEG